jgi:hypothetical protein
MRKQQIGGREKKTQQESKGEREREREKRTNQVSRSQIARSQCGFTGVQNFLQAPWASCSLKDLSLTFDRVTGSFIFNMECVSNALGTQQFPS